MSEEGTTNTDAVKHTQHSPAPWGVTEDGDWLQLDGGAKPIVNDRYMSICVTATSDPDKRLICAAPDLLAALIELHRTTDLRSLRGLKHVPSMREQQQAMLMASAAIAKAEGR